MYWKAILKDGTEIREGDLIPGAERPVLHDGEPTGAVEPVPYSPGVLEPEELSIFSLHMDDTHEVAYQLGFPEKGEKLLYIRRTAKNALTNETLRLFYLVGKYSKKDGVILARVHPTGVVEHNVDPTEAEFDFSHQKSLSDTEREALTKD